MNGPRVGLLVISHDGIGPSLVETAHQTFGVLPLAVRQLAAATGLGPDHLVQDAMRLIAELDTGAGVLVLTDLYGATPSNIAARLADLPNVRIIAGMNLPMVVRVFNYAQLPLPELLEKALTGGRDGVVVIGPAPARPEGR